MTKKLTSKLLKRLISEEREKIKNAIYAKEVKAKDIAKTVDDQIDQIKRLNKLKKEQQKIAKKFKEDFKKIYEQRKRIKRKLVRRL